MLELFSYGFLVRAFLAGTMIAVVAPLLGMFLTVRRYALIADTLSHASLAGLAIGVLLGIDPFFAAIGTAVLLALGIERLRSTGRFSGDALLATVLTGSLAFAIVVMSATRGLDASLLTYLFGSISTVTSTDLVVIGVLSTLVVFTTLFCYRKFFLIAFDEDIARASGMRVTALNMLLAVMTAVTVAIAMRVVGVLLIGALMVIPVLSAMQFNRGFRVTASLAVLFSVIAVVVGILLSFTLNLATGGTIVLVAIAIFLLSLLAKAIE